MVKEKSLPNKVVINSKNIHKKIYDPDTHKIVVFYFDDVEMEEFIS